MRLSHSRAQAFNSGHPLPTRTKSRRTCAQPNCGSRSDRSVPGRSPPADRRSRSGVGPATNCRPRRQPVRQACGGGQGVGRIGRSSRTGPASGAERQAVAGGAAAGENSFGCPEGCPTCIDSASAPRYSSAGTYRHAGGATSPAEARHRGEGRARNPGCPGGAATPGLLGGTVRAADEEEITGGRTSFKLEGLSCAYNSFASPGREDLPLRTPPVPQAASASAKACSCSCASGYPRP